MNICWMCILYYIRFMFCCVGFACNVVRLVSKKWTWWRTRWCLRELGFENEVLERFANILFEQLNAMNRLCDAGRARVKRLL